MRYSEDIDLVQTESGKIGINLLGSLMDPFDEGRNE
jgi:hypothetical protein